MIRKYMRTKLVEQRTEERREVICDGCGQTVRDGEGFFEISTGHRRWGNDSVDSLEMRHFCCKVCMDAFLDDYWRTPEDTDHADIEFISSTARAVHYPDDEVQVVRVLEEKQ